MSKSFVTSVFVCSILMSVVALAETNIVEVGETLKIESQEQAETL